MEHDSLLMENSLTILKIKGGKGMMCKKGLNILPPTLQRKTKTARKIITIFIPQQNKERMKNYFPLFFFYM